MKRYILTLNIELMFNINLFLYNYLGFRRYYLINLYHNMYNGMICVVVSELSIWSPNLLAAGAVESMLGFFASVAVLDEARGFTSSL